MAKLENGILGTTTGKVGPVVCQRWKTINIVRQYTIPTDRKSEAQLLYRDKMRFLNTFSRVNLQGVILTGFTNYCKGTLLSPVHAFFRFNMKVPDIQNNIENMVISQGLLLPPYLQFARKNNVNGTVEIAWNTDTNNISKNNDNITLYLLKQNDSFFSKLSLDHIARSDGFKYYTNADDNIQVGDMIFIVASQSDEDISNSDGIRVSLHTP